MSMYDRFELEPPRRKGLPPALVVGILLGGLLLVVAAAGTAAYLVATGAIGGVPRRAEESYEEKSRAAREAYDAEHVGAGRAEEAAIRELFVALYDANDRAKHRLFDFDRMMLELQAAGMPRRAMGDMRRQAEQQLPQQVVADQAAVPGTTFQLRHIDRLADPDERLVWIVVQSPDGTYGKIRYWVRRHEGEWRIYDHEDLYFAYRLSSLLANLMTEAISGRFGQQNVAAAQQLSQVAVLVRQGDLERADRLLQGVSQERVPQVMRGVLADTTAGLRIQQQRWQEALDAIATAERAGVKGTGIPLLKAEALIGLGRHAEALSPIEGALAALGDDALGRRVLGDALAGLGRSEEAAAAYRRALELHGDCGEAILGLALVLPAEGGPEVRECYARLTSPELWLVTIGEHLQMQGRFDMLLAIAEEHRRLVPEDVNADYYEGVCLHAQGQPERAAELFRQALEVADADLRPVLEEELQWAMIDMGRPLEAYQQAADPQAAFETIVGHLWDYGNLAAIRELIDAHRLRHGGGPELALQEGWLAYEEDDHAGAEALFRSAMDEAQDDETRYEAQEAFLSAATELGRGVEGYLSAADGQQAFQQVAMALDYRRDADGLEGLLAAHTVRWPLDDVTYYRGRALFHRGQFAEAAAILDPRRQPNLDQEARSGLLSAYLEARASEGRTLEAYRTADDPIEAFAILARTLLARQETAALETLVQEHLQSAAQDPWGHYYRGQVHLLRDEADLADAAFAHAMDLPGDEWAQTSARSARLQASVVAGRAVQAYETIAPARQTFQELAWQCEAEQLEPLLALHRVREPDDPALPTWELELAWKKQEYATVVERARLCQQLPPEQQPYMGESYLVRALTRMKRFDEALAAAQEANSHGQDPYYDALVHAVAGHVPEAEAALERCLSRGHTSDEFYLDDDLGPALRGAAFAAFRQRCPPPEEEDLPVREL